MPLEENGFHSMVWLIPIQTRIEWKNRVVQWRDEEELESREENLVEEKVKRESIESESWEKVEWKSWRESQREELS